MDAQERTSFVTAYTKLVTTAWSDEKVGDRLVSDPKAVLAEFGLSIPAGSSVNVVRRIPASGDHSPNLETQIKLWDQGKQSGTYEIHVPETPQLDTAELQEADLESVAAGVGNICCCCCPCCSCT